MSVFRESLVFFDQIGLYDVVLPFLLVFTLVFGVLEKSKILGTEKQGDKGQVSRKNLNSMVAFCTGFFVVASAQLVSLINVFVSRVALILVILVMFMLLLGSMHKQQDANGFDFFTTHKNVFYVLMGLISIALVLIFLDGVGWLGPLWEYVNGSWDSNLMGTIMLFVVVVGFIWFITGSPKESKA
jgi:predicted membrane channel-forming protein YqfA (hemolysin III family)